MGGDRPATGNRRQGMTLPCSGESSQTNRHDWRAWAARVATAAARPIAERMVSQAPNQGCTGGQDCHSDHGGTIVLCEHAKSKPSVQPVYNKPLLHSD